MKTALIILVAVYLLYAALSGVYARRRFGRTLLDKAGRLTLYKGVILEGFVAALVIGALAVLSGYRLGADLGIGPPSGHFQAGTMFSIVICILGAVVFCMFVLQTITLARGGEAREKAWRKLTDGRDGDVILKDTTANMLIPRSRDERKRFLFVALSAGICEEFIMRSVLFAVIQTLAPELNIFLLPVLSGVIFGVCHIYQGIGGTLKAAAAGIALGYLYIASGSILPCMLLHATVDYANCFLFPERETAN
jgi:membrane protease YdiL (CAAX protease family)